MDQYYRYIFVLNLTFYGSIFLLTFSPGCTQKVVRVVPVEFGERHDTRTKSGQQYTAADHAPADQSGKRVES